MIQGLGFRVLSSTSEFQELNMKTASGEFRRSCLSQLQEFGDVHLWSSTILVNSK